GGSARTGGTRAGYDRGDQAVRDERGALSHERERRRLAWRRVAGEEGHEEGGWVLREGARDASRPQEAEGDATEVEKGTVTVCPAHSFRRSPTGATSNVSAIRRSVSLIVLGAAACNPAAER